MKRVRARAQRPPGMAAGFMGTVTVHAALVGLLLFGVKTPRPGPPVYAVNLVAAPLPRPEAKRAPEAVERPVEEPTPAPPKPKPKPEPVKKAPVPKPTPKKIEPEVKREPAPRQATPATPAPGETPGTGSDALTISTPGLVFAYPEYLENIVNQVYRRWERPLGNAALRAEVNFLIMKDGTVRDIRFITRSGNFSFDLSTQGAIEAAGNSLAFGPLPDGYAADVLPVTFIFNPRTGR